MTADAQPVQPQAKSKSPKLGNVKPGPWDPDDSD